MGKHGVKPRSLDAIRVIIQERCIKDDVTGCWVWQGTVGSHGYGVLSFNGVARLTHRVAYEAFVGPVPEGKCLMHSCDNRLCVNPQHCTPGTLAENNQDMFRKGRGCYPPLFDRDTHPHSILTSHQAKEIQDVYNVWVGASTPPDFMFGKELSLNQKERMLDRTLDVLMNVDAPIKWVSVEPLSWDVSEIFDSHIPVKWVVIGAASNGRTKYQPEAEHVEKLLRVLDSQNVNVFFKGNLKWSPWREEFPNG